VHAWLLPAAARFSPLAAHAAASGFPLNLSRATSAVIKDMKKQKQILRLRKRAEFLSVRNGEKRRGPLFLLEVRKRTEEESEAAKIGEKPRAGFTVTKKNGNAVVRNRIRRRLREAVRCHVGSDMAPSTDYVIVAREQALTAPFSKLTGELSRRITAPEGRRDEKKRRTERPESGPVNGK
jgi:ribonuclease P protein component